MLHMILAMHTDYFAVHHKKTGISNGNILLSVRDKGKIKESRNRAGVVQRVPGRLGSQIS